MIPKIHKRRQFDGGIQDLYKIVGSFSLTKKLNKKVPTFKPNTNWSATFLSPTCEFFF